MGWRRDRGEASLSDVHRTIKVAADASIWRRALAFVGPGYLVSVGYMDPGNWATSIAGGAQFGYTLLVVALMSNIMAIILPSLCARLAIATGRDLAQACRDAFPKPVAWVLWLFAEIAIIATDIAEVVGTAIGLTLLFGVPLEIGVVITALDVFLILYLQRLGFRWIEAFIICLLGVIAVCFAVQIAMADPAWGQVIRGFAPTTEIVTNPQMLYLALGIIGATVMPHNLYLHSGVVQTRAYGQSDAAKREALTFATIDSTVALMFALLVNASILILAAATFNRTGHASVAELRDAHAMLAPLLGSMLAPKLFAVALVRCGLNSTGDRDLGRPDRDGRLPAHPFAGVAEKACHPHIRDHPGRRCHHCLWRAGDGGTPHPEPGDPHFPIAFRHRALGDVHTRPRKDGGAHIARMAHHRLGRDRRHHHRPQCEDDRRLGAGLIRIWPFSASSPVKYRASAGDISGLAVGDRGRGQALGASRKQRIYSEYQRLSGNLTEKFRPDRDISMA